MCVWDGEHHCRKFKKNHDTVKVNGHSMPVHYCRQCGRQWLDFGAKVLEIGDSRAPITFRNGIARSEV